MKKIKPVDGRLLVLPFSAEDVTSKDGIIIPAKAQARSTEDVYRCEVVSHGKLSIEAPKAVMINKYAGCKINEFDGSGSFLTYILIKEDDIIATIPVEEEYNKDYE